MGRQKGRRRTFLQLLLKPGFCGRLKCHPRPALCSCVPSRGTAPQGAPSLINKDSLAPPPTTKWHFPNFRAGTDPLGTSTGHSDSGWNSSTCQTLCCCVGRAPLVLSPARGYLLAPMLRGPLTCCLAELDWGQVTQLCPWVPWGPRLGLGSLVYPPPLLSCSL